MMAMVKILLFMLVVFKATAFESSREIDSNHELQPYSSPPPSPLSYSPQASRNVDEEGPGEGSGEGPPGEGSGEGPPGEGPPGEGSGEGPPGEGPPGEGPGPSTKDCVSQCEASCEDKKSLKKILCIGFCVVKCILKPSDSLDEIACAVDCAQSAANSLRYDSNVMNDQVSSCKEQCKKY